MTSTNRRPRHRVALRALVFAVAGLLAERTLDAVPTPAKAAAHQPTLASSAADRRVASVGRASVTPDGFTVARPPYAFRFPADHASHPGYQSEWWYFTGHVRTASGRRFGYELTFFRIGIAPGDPRPTATQSKWRGNELFPAHFALTDEQGKTFFHVDRFAREALGMGAASATTLDVRADDWSLRGAPAGDPERERMTMHASDGVGASQNAIDFVQLPEKPPAIHGHDGVSRKAACGSCASHYYSYTRLKTTGTLTYHGERLAVEGISWMDHEFGSGELQRDQAGWDWFSIQLDDDRELMLYRLRQKDGSVTPQSSGSIVARDGTVTYLPLDAFAVEKLGTWTSPHTGGVYPSGWRVRVPSARVDLTLAPTVQDQELAGTSAGGVSYWEGAVDVTDSATHAPLGVGYVELTGYAGAISL
jgi:predicted secreted hydrolase